MVLDLVELKHLLTSLLTNGVPLSLMILWGTPNLTIIFSLMKFATAPPVALRSRQFNVGAFSGRIRLPPAVMGWAASCDGGP